MINHLKKEQRLPKTPIPRMSPFDRNSDEFSNKGPTVVVNVLKKFKEVIIHENGTKIDEYLREAPPSTKKTNSPETETPQIQIPIDEQIKHAKTEGALAMQSVALIATSSGLISVMIEKAFHKSKNSVAAKIFSLFIARYKREFDETLFAVIMEFVTDFDKGNIDAIWPHLEEGQRQELVRQKENLGNVKERTLIEQLNGLLGISGPSICSKSSEFDSRVVNACNEIIQDLRSYPTVQHPTKQELILIKFRDAPGHVVSEENLKPIFGKSSNSAKNLHRKLPDINQRLKPYGLRIQRPDKYMVEGVST